MRAAESASGFAGVVVAGVEPAPQRTAKPFA
jgi:hypothetical protein